MRIFFRGREKIEKGRKWFENDKQSKSNSSKTITLSIKFCKERKNHGRRIEILGRKCGGVKE